MISLHRFLSHRQVFITLSIVIALTITLAFLITQLATAADEALNVRTHHDGTYGIVSAGVGLDLADPAVGDSFVLNVPGPVVQAFLFWAG